MFTQVLCSADCRSFSAAQQLTMRYGLVPLRFIPAKFYKAAECYLQIFHAIFIRNKRFSRPSFGKSSFVFVLFSRCKYFLDKMTVGTA